MDRIQALNLGHDDVVHRADPRGLLGDALDDAIIATLKAGRQGQVLFQDAQRREVGVPLSLLGVTAGLAALAN